METPSESTSNDSRETIGAVLGRVPSGLFVLTAIDGTGHETGMLASWVQQVGFDPPAVSIAVQKARYLNTWISAVPRLALSILADGQTSLLKHFGRGFEPYEPAFNGLSIARTASGLPYLTSALGYLEGDVVNQCDAGDHFVYILKITGAGRSDTMSITQPIVHIRRNGFRY